MDMDAIQVNAEAVMSLQTRQALIEQQRQVRELAARDRQVRAHEQAHAAVGGAYAGHPHYDFTRGPNGVRYATSGHVNIDVSEVHGDPRATLEKMQTVVKAALAPAQPSPQDRAVAAKAAQKAVRARAELASAEHKQMHALSAQREMGSTAGAYVNIEL